MGRDDRTIISVEKTGSLYFLVNAFLGAYNRRTEAWKALQEPIQGGGVGGKDQEILDRIDFLTVELTQVRNELGNVIIPMLEALNRPKTEVRFVFKVANDHQDEAFSISIGGVTDVEGEPLPDAKGLTVDVKSSDDAVVGVSFDSSTNSGVASFGHSGVASLTATVTNAKGDILGSGAADFTVTTGDPAAVSDVKIAFSGITEEPPAEPA